VERRQEMGWYSARLGNRSLEEYLREGYSSGREVADVEVVPTDGAKQVIIYDSLEAKLGDPGKATYAAQVPADYEAEAYLAVRRTRGVEGEVVLCRYEADIDSWMFKDVHEIMGPAAARCPPRIVAQLTDPDVLIPTLRGRVRRRGAGDWACNSRIRV
jgi:hypothetical protein